MNCWWRTHSSHISHSLSSATTSSTMDDMFNPSTLLFGENMVLVYFAAIMSGQHISTALKCLHTLCAMTWMKKACNLTHVTKFKLMLLNGLHRSSSTSYFAHVPNIQRSPFQQMEYCENLFHFVSQINSTQKTNAGVMNGFEWKIVQNLMKIDVLASKKSSHFFTVNC